jgi:hypothetical protein
MPVLLVVLLDVVSIGVEVEFVVELVWVDVGVEVDVELVKF